MNTEKKPLKYYQDKLFVGGLSFKTTDQSLEKYFSKFGAIKQANVMKYTDRQVSRGFGFCIFESPASAELAMQTKTHVIDGRKVDVRWALPKEMAPPPQSSADQPAKSVIRKVFVGGLSIDTNDNDLRQYFSRFGEIESASVMYHHDKRHSRGFGFVLFKNGNSVNAVIQSTPHVICGKTVDVKKAYPKDDLSSQPEQGEVLTELDAAAPKLYKERSQPMKQKQAFPLDSSQSPLGDDHLQMPPRREPLSLEFFDEQDNNPLPSKYTQDALPGVSSPSYTGFPKASGLFRSLGYHSNDLSFHDRLMQPSDAQPSQRFYTQYENDPYGQMNTTWSIDRFPSSFLEGSPHQMSSQFVSAPGDQDLLGIGSNRRLSHPEAMASLPAHGYFSQRDTSLFDSVGSAGSHHAMNPTLFPSQNMPYRGNYLATDAGMEEFEPGFFSGEGRSRPDLSDLRDGDYFQSSRDDAFMEMGSDKITWSSFTDRSGEEIDSILDESTNNRTINYRKRTQNHTIFNSGSENQRDN